MSQIKPNVAVASVDEVRARFPALERRHNGQAVAYFDGPGGTQVPGVVADRVTDYLLHHNANTHWAYPTSRETDALIDEARHALADFLNSSADEVVFGANMTTLTFHLARALGRGWGPGDEVVVTELDHHANVAPWQQLVRERGITLRMVRMDPATGSLDHDDLARLINGRTRLLAIGAASNALGTISDVGAAVGLAHAEGAQVFVDAVHYAPHRLVDVRAWDCDFLACSAYKFYGPHVGVLYGRREALAALDVPKLRPAPDTVPERLETGTKSHEGVVGAAAAVDFLAGLATVGATRRERLEAVFQTLHDRGSSLLGRLWSGLEGIPGVRLHGPGPGQPRTPTLSFTMDRHTPETVCARLAERALFASHGDFYATTVAERLGRAGDGFVRIGCACYTTDDEIDRLIAVVAAMVRE
ncbi:MAG: cysteine desulfurase-like protein [Isosphaeraceae bacterium]|nr:cysteine desulfurase-like protein [Isosphaeraceae bacterium]